MSNGIVTKKLNVVAASELIQDIQDNTAYYVFAAKHIPYPSGDVPPGPVDSVEYTTTNVYDDMLYGKKVKSSDTAFMIPRYDWQSNTVYTMYNDTDATLYGKAFYAGVEDGDNYRVYKCLHNNSGANSTVEPSGTSTIPFESEVDGYVWQYMYTANSHNMSKFATTKYVPCTPDANVTANAVAGAIDFIETIDAGSGYSNYITGYFTYNQIRVSGDPKLYSLNSSAPNTADFYNGCMIYMTTGDCSGQYREIVDYFSRTIQLDSAFDGTVADGDEYEIYPKVYVYDNGGKATSNCAARAIISPTSNTVSRIEIIDRGAGYRKASAFIKSSNTAAVTTEATLHAIISPPGGHGSNVVDELGANYVAVCVTFNSNEEALKIDNDFRQVGIIREPLFNNVAINFTSNVGIFSIGETLYQYNDYILAGTAETVNANNTIVGTGTYFEASLSAGDKVLITDGNQNLFTTVAAVASNTSMTVADAPSFSNTTCTIAYVNAVSYGTITGINDNDSVVYVSGVQTSGLTSSTKIIADGQYSTAEVNISNTSPVTINGRNVNNFNTFNQLILLEGDASGTFTEDEYVYQPSTDQYAQPAARVFSTFEDIADYMYVTNTNNSIRADGSINSIFTGNSSGATFTVSAKYDGDLVVDSGRVVYLENLSAVSRANGQSETVKLILEF